LVNTEISRGFKIFQTCNIIHVQSIAVGAESSSNESSTGVAPLLFDSRPRKLLAPCTVDRFEKLSIDLSDEGAHGGRYVGLHAIRFKVFRTSRNIGLHAM